MGTAKNAPTLPFQGLLFAKCSDFPDKIICLPTISLGLQNEGAVLAEALDGKAKVNLLWIIGWEH